MISLDPNSNQDGVLSLHQNTGPNYPQDHVDDLSAKYDLALGKDSAGQPALASAISSNGQDRLAELYSMRKGIDLENTRNTLIQQIANQTGGSPTPAAIGAVRSLSEQEINSPKINSAFEQAYAKQITNSTLDATNVKTNGAYDQAIVTDPQTTNQMLDISENQTSRNMIAQNILTDLQKKFDNSDMFNKGQAWAQQFIPFRSWAAMGNTGKTSLPSNILPGDSLETQHAFMNTLSPSEYKQKFQERVDELVSQGDYLDAIQWAQSMLAYSDSDKNWQNIMAGVDVASTLPVGTVLKVLKGSSKAVNIALREGEALAKVTGLEAESATVAASKALEHGTLPLSDVSKPIDIERVVPSISRPAEVFSERPTRASAAVVGRLQVGMLSRAKDVVEFLTGTNKLNRLPPEELAKVMNIAKDATNKEFVDQSSNLINIRHGLPDNQSNVATVIAEFGKKDGSWFPDEKGAKAWGTRVLGKKTNEWTAVEVPEGTGWRVEVSRNVDESKAGIRDFSISTDSKNADNFFTRTMSYLMGADTKLSPEQQMARSVALESTERQSQLLSGLAKPLGDLSKDKKSFKQFESFLKTSRDRVHPERGRGAETYHTYNEFEDAWFTQFQTIPTEAQSHAWLSYKQMYDTDWMVRNLDVYKQKAIMGIEKFEAKRLVGSLKDIKMAEPLVFEGKIVDRLPYGGPNFRVAVLDEDGMLVSGLKSDSRFMVDRDRAALDAKIADGYTVVQAYEGSTTVGDKSYNFVMMKNFKKDKVALDLDYKNGGRTIQKYPYYIKQSKLNFSGSKAFYNGDMAIANARDAKDGQFILDKMETARKMELGNHPGTKAYFEQHLPMWNYDDFTKSVGDQNIDLRVPFTLTKSGSRTIDTNILDRLKAEGHQIDGIETNDAYRLSNQVRGRFLGEPSDLNMKTWGVEKDSIFELATDSVLSPMETLKLSMGDMIDVNVMNDYKIKSVRDFTQQFGHLLDATQADFDANGLKYIYNPVYRKGIDDASKRGAEAVRKAILNLWQHSTSVDRTVGIYKEQIVRSVRNSLGDAMGDFTDGALTTAGNADKYMRAFAFHTRIGMFNPKQLFLQASTAVQIVAISPKYGTKAAMLISPIMAGLKAPTDEILRGVGVKLAGSMGIKPDDYVELIQMYKRSGFDHVGGDISYIDDLSAPKLVQGAFGKILDMGTIPYKAGERISRTMAFAAAYLERKAAGNALTRVDEAWMLKRAKDMTGNMTRDSNAPYQQGFTSIASQFFGYQMRLMEQMVGSKLTLAEKGRMVGAMSLLYGVPVGAGMSFGVAPVRDMFKHWMTQNGVQTDDTVFEPFVDGFAAELLKVVSGTKFDVAGRYGPNGINNFGDLINGDTSFFNLLMGASGGEIFNTLSDADPIIRGFFSFVNPWDRDKFPVVAQDWLQPLSEISTANTVIKAWKAANLGAWVSKNENKLTNINDIENVIGSVLGLDPQRVSDAFTDIDVMNQIKDWQAKDEKLMISDYKRSFQALKDGNNTLAQTYMNRATMRGHSANFTPDQFNQAIHRAMKDGAMDESVFKQFMKVNK